VHCHGLEEEEEEEEEEEMMMIMMMFSLSPKLISKPF
jgi:hypothetical protein